MFPHCEWYLCQNCARPVVIVFSLLSSKMSCLPEALLGCTGELGTPCHHRASPASGSRHTPHRMEHTRSSTPENAFMNISDETAMFCLKAYIWLFLSYQVEMPDVLCLLGCQIWRHKVVRFEDLHTVNCSPVSRLYQVLGQVHQISGNESVCIICEEYIGRHTSSIPQRLVELRLWCPSCSSNNQPWSLSAAFCRTYMFYVMQGWHCNDV